MAMGMAHRLVVCVSVSSPATKLQGPSGNSTKVSMEGKNREMQSAKSVLWRSTIQQEMEKDIPIRKKRWESFKVQEDEETEEEEVDEDEDEYELEEEEEEFEVRDVESKEQKRNDFLKAMKLNMSYRLRTIRAARELALCVLYAGLHLEMHPMKVFESRMQEKIEPVEREIMEQYNHTPDHGEPINVYSEVEKTRLETLKEQETEIEATVLSSHPIAVYSNYARSYARKIIEATSERWIKQEAIVNDLHPSGSKESEKLVETVIIHMAIAEIEVLQVPRSIVFSEALELAKRFCDHRSPKVVHYSLHHYFVRRQLVRSMSPVGKELQASLCSSLYESMEWKDEYRD